MGMWGYLRNPYNRFDLLVVVFSLFELLVEVLRFDNTLSGLQSTQSLRVIRVLRGYRVLQSQDTEEHTVTRQLAILVFFVMRCVRR